MADDLIQRLKSQDIDAILNEIDEQEIYNQQSIPSISIDWNEIIHNIQNGGTNFIKNLITSKDIDINAQNPENGLTLLHYAIAIGNYDLVKALCNFGADVNIKDNDGDDALKYAIIYSKYKITELIYYRQLSSSLGNDLRDIATQIHLRTEEAKHIKKTSRALSEAIF